MFPVPHIEMTKAAGKDGKFKGLQPRHAKLSVGSASRLAIYLLEPHQLRRYI
ncbi:hypothetical protein M472_00045 [Sphingobacterium paucimobilis HER1398]|uniref:Uncharacterized protein n=1 Tax=Sphingobacterium paucimobilis HER1398 TaxID=1346330 RepID=U2IWU1_9SPHI|nr:hypothetical protein M472_00045 [Sphingobacterium paucimobilis HER1398]